MVWLRAFFNYFFLNYLHCLCYILFSNQQIGLGPIFIPDWGGGAGRDRTGHTDGHGTDNNMKIIC